MRKKDRQRIRETSLQMDKPFTVTALKMRLPDLVFGSAASKGKDWRNVLDEMVVEGALTVYKQGASAPLGGNEGDEKQRKYMSSFGEFYGREVVDWLDAGAPTIEELGRMAQIAKKNGVTIPDVQAAMSEMPRNPSVEEFVRIMKKHGITVPTQR
jgi:DNA-binding phage protein